MDERVPRVSQLIARRVEGAFRFDSIKSRIVVLALLATLIPSLSMAWISYRQNRAALTEKITQELRSVSAQAAREMDLWLKERLYDIRVFVSSFEVTENVRNARRSGSGVNVEAVARLNEYLRSVDDRFPDYEELLILAPDSQIIATSAERHRPVNLPDGWVERLSADQPVVGEAYFDSTVGRAVMTVTTPIQAATGRLLGALSAKVNFVAVERILYSFSPGDAGELYLITRDGMTVIGSRSQGQLLGTQVPRDATDRLFAAEDAALEFVNADGLTVVGSVKPVPRLDWAVVAEIPRNEAYAQVARLRRLTILLVSGLLLGVGAIAYFLGHLIVRPLDRLTTGAAEVAGGDLAVELPIRGGGEVGLLTEVFNNMVTRLREGRRELERLSVTDSLTGLSNRRKMMEALTHEVQRADRSNHSFAILMADVDRFKKLNDTHGHMIGDEVLKRVAAVLRESTRDVDRSARYGGEEFLVILPETNLEGAVEAAERIRTRLADQPVQVGDLEIKVTLSIGVAEYPTHGDRPDPLIAAADAALYQAKRRGRNRVARPGTTTKSKRA